MAEFELEVDGGKIAGVDHGDGFPVVFLHAGVADSRMWQPQIDSAAEEIRSIAYDRRGFGKTVSENVEFNEVDDLEAILNHLEVGAAIFVGCSQGGRLAIDFALRNPERAAGLVLISTAVSGAPWPELPPQYDLITRALDLAEATGDVKFANEIEAHAWLDGPLQNRGRVKSVVRDLFLDMNSIALKHEDLPLEINRTAAWINLSQIVAPTLLVCGEYDFQHVIERHNFLSEGLINSAEVVIEGCAHMLSLERPDLCNPLLSQFLGSY